MVVLLRKFQSIKDDDNNEIQFETSDVTKTIVVEGNGGSEVRIDENDYVTFIMESGEVKTGRVTKVSSKAIQVKQTSDNLEVICPLEDIKERTLQISGAKNETDEDDVEEDNEDE